VGCQRYFLTICTAFRLPIFTSSHIVDSTLLQLQQTSAVFEFAITAYCFMPDHLHVLVAGESDQSNFQKFVKVFKQMSGFRHRREARAALWQPGYHERILRDGRGNGCYRPVHLGESNSSGPGASA
jgi:putative transposase